jgi:hypothetical protein
VRPIYLRKDTNNGIRKVQLDMPYLVSHKVIRLPKRQWEDELYLPYKPERTNIEFEKYFLSRDKIVNEDSNFYFFEFPFRPEQVETVAV